MNDLYVESLVVKYGDTAAVDGVSFHVDAGEWVTLLGPSGCGKSTTLAAVAGLERPTAGRIMSGSRVFFDGTTGSHLGAEHRDVGLVFQSYALFPHLSVRGNCEYPLRRRGHKRSERRELVDDALALVGMETYADRYPHQLSGGQQQRVALARTLVYRPGVLLLDEPLSNLDARVREKARDWLKDLQQKVGLTTLFVTHDQSEALALSDRIVVMDGGRISQAGPPTEIYEKPSNRFVADFVGTMSFMKAMVEGGDMAILSDGQKVPLRDQRPDLAGREVTLALRPEAVTLSRSKENGLTGEVLSSSYMGGRYSHAVGLASGMVRVEADRQFPLGPVKMSVKPEAVLVFQ